MNEFLDSYVKRKIEYIISSRFKFKILICGVYFLTYHLLSTSPTVSGYQYNVEMNELKRCTCVEDNISRWKRAGHAPKYSEDVVL